MKTLIKSVTIILLWLILMIVSAPTKAQTITTVAGASTGVNLGGTSAVAIDSAGNIYVAGGGTNTIKQITASATNTFGTGVAGFSGDNGPASAATFNNPEGLYIFKSKLYIADTKNRRIRMVDLKTNIVTTIANTGLGGTTGVAVDSAGNIYVAGGGANFIKQITPQGTNQFGTGTAGFDGDNGAASLATFNNPTSLYINHSKLYVADARNKRIRVINLATNIVTTVLGGANSAIGVITSVAADDGNNVFFTTGGANNLIAKIDAAGTLSVIAGGSAIGGYSGDGGPAVNAGLNNPTNLYIKDKDLYVADQKNRAIRKLSNTTILPLSLLSFTATAQQPNILLQWKTTLEVNVAEFVIEKSVDANNFQVIGTVKSKGNGSTDAQSYAFTDNNPSIGKNFYRLKMKDVDGSFSYSPIVTASIEFASAIAVFPTPATSFIELRNTTSARLTTPIIVTDLMGKTILQTQLVASLKISCTNWSAGIYFIKFEDGSSIKIMKQ